MPARTKMVSPASARSMARWMVRKGASLLPGLPSSPSGATKSSAAPASGATRNSRNTACLFMESTSLYPCVASANADQGPPGVPAFEQGLEGFRQALERQFLGQGEVELLREKIGGDALPDLQPQLARRGHGVDAEQVHAAQDERHDGGVEFMAAGQADAGDRAPPAGGARQPGEHLAADVIDRTLPERLFQRPPAVVDVLAQQHTRCAQLLQVIL